MCGQHVRTYLLTRMTSLFCLDMVNIFEQFLPQLLLYPNPSDPLNTEAANLLLKEPKVYEARVKGR